MSESTRDGRTRILDAAEALMAERGVDAVSLREINVAAGQRNASGIQYHFGDRGGLIAAVVERHLVSIDRERHALLDQLTEGDITDVRLIVEALVVPLAARLSAPSGRFYLRILGQLAAGAGAAAIGRDPGRFNTSLRRAMGHLTPMMDDLTPGVVAVRTELVTSFLLRALADRAQDSRVSTLTDTAFVANLVDVLVATLMAPASPEAQEHVDAPPE